METKQSTTSEKIFMSFGIITVLSGIFLIKEENWLIGVSGSSVGLWLILDNFKKLKAKTTVK